MSKRKILRPTKTNIDEYLLDFDGIDFSQFSCQHEASKPDQKDVQGNAVTMKRHRADHDGDGNVAALPRFFF